MRLLLAAALLTVAAVAGWPQSAAAKKGCCYNTTDASQYVEYADSNRGWQECMKIIQEKDRAAGGTSGWGWKLIEDDQECVMQGAERSSWVSSILCPGKATTDDCEIIPRDCRVGGGSGCDINDLLTVVANIAKLMLGLLGSAAFAMFVYGGLVWLMAAGNQERVNKGRQIITNASLGILVVLVSYTAINLLVSALTAGRGGIGSIANIFSNQWNKGP